MYLYICSPLIALGIDVLCQVLYCRYRKEASLLMATFFGFSCGLFGLLIIGWCQLQHIALLFTDNLASITVNLISYIALGYCYFHFINLGETARRIRLLQELLESNNGLSEKEILERYNAKEIIEKRLSRLLKSRQIIHKNRKYYIGNPIMLFAASIIIFLKLFILGRRSEFD